MKTKLQNHEIPSRTIQSKRSDDSQAFMPDNRETTQMKLIDTIQRVGEFEEEEEALQGKFVTQLQTEEEELL